MKMGHFFMMIARERERIAREEYLRACDAMTNEGGRE